MLRFALLKEERATVTDKGIRFRGVFYYSDVVGELKWLDKAKNDGRFKIDIRYTDVNTTHIWCRHPDTDKVIQLEITDRSARYKNRLWTQVLAHMDHVKESLACLDERRFCERVLLEMDLDELDDAANLELKRLKTSQARSIEKGVKARKQATGDIEIQAQYEQMLMDLEMVTAFTSNPDPRIPQNDDLRDPTYYTSSRVA